MDLVDVEPVRASASGWPAPLASDVTYPKSAKGVPDLRHLARDCGFHCRHETHEGDGIVRIYPRILRFASVEVGWSDELPAYPLGGTQGSGLIFLRGGLVSASA